MSYKVILCDIEGTTTSISFVKENLFPYAAKNVSSYLDAKWDAEDTREAVKLLRDQSVTDKADNVDGCVEIAAETEDKAKQIETLVANVKWQMEHDRKAGPLKNLQGLMWVDAYKEGAFKGQVYSDVAPAFEAWTKAGRKVYIYSSGSAAIQKVHFEHSEAGDLAKYLSGYFDTKVGAKQEKSSYEAIFKEVAKEDAALNAAEVLFLTDIPAEAKAAKEAGMEAILLKRPGNAELTEADEKTYKVVESFAEIPVEEEPVAAKRKIDDVAAQDEAVPPAKVAKIEEKDTPATETVESTPAAPVDDVDMKTTEEEKKPTEAAKEEVEKKKEESVEATTTASTTSDDVPMEQEKEKETVEEKKQEEQATPVVESTTTTTTTTATDKTEDNADKEKTGESPEKPAAEEEKEAKKDVIEEEKMEVDSTTTATVTKDDQEAVKPTPDAAADDKTDDKKTEAKAPESESKESDIKTTTTNEESTATTTAAEASTTTDKQVDEEEKKKDAEIIEKDTAEAMEKTEKKQDAEVSKVTDDAKAPAIETVDSADKTTTNGDSESTPAATEAVTNGNGTKDASEAVASTNGHQDANNDSDKENDKSMEEAPADATAPDAAVATKTDEVSTTQQEGEVVVAKKCAALDTVPVAPAAEVEAES